MDLELVFNFGVILDFGLWFCYPFFFFWIELYRLNIGKRLHLILVFSKLLKGF